MFKKCKHDYVILKDYKIKSALETLLESGLESTEGGSIRMARSKLVIVYKCTKCNKIKETIICNID